jgi:hypothetical protein
MELFTFIVATALTPDCDNEGAVEGVEQIVAIRGERGSYKPGQSHE